VGKGTLTQFADPASRPGLTVTNESAATGGRDAETLENAKRRGPQEIHRFGRAVTARDYELVATQSPGSVGRANAFAEASLWRHARPGTVQVRLVPGLPGADAIINATTADLVDRQTDAAADQVREALAAQALVGTAVEVVWARYKAVGVKANVVLHRGQNARLARARLERAVRTLLSPLPLVGDGWPFGAPLRASDLYDVLLRDDAVRFVENLTMTVALAPTDVRAITADLHQERTWFCGAGQTLFRTMDDGEGWDPVKVFEGTTVDVVAVHPRVPGLVVVAGQRTEDTKRSEVWASRDCGESWARLREVDHVNDVAIAVLHQPDGEIAFLAADTGLLRIPVPADLGHLDETAVVPVAVQLLSDLKNPALYAVAVVEYAGGDVSIAAALADSQGVLLSHQGGRPGTFLPPTLRGKDIRCLVVGADGPRRYLTAAFMAAETERGTGAATVELVGPETVPDPDWVWYTDGWVGGSCQDLAACGDWLVAASHRSGVLALNVRAQKPTWVPSTVGCGIPARDPDGPFQSVDHVAANPGGLVLAASSSKLYKRDDVTGDDIWKLASDSSFRDRVTLSPSWLFLTSTVELEVEEETKP
jgi:hypothetical protein